MTASTAVAQTAPAAPSSQPDAPSGRRVPALPRVPVPSASVVRRPHGGACRSLPLSVCVLAAVAAGCLAALAMRSIVLLFAIPPLVLLARARIADARRRADEAAQREAVADLCTALRAELEAGRLPEQAFAEAIWCRPQLRDLADRRFAQPNRASVQDGPGDEPESLREALHRSASAPGREELAALAACWAAAERHGIAFAEAVRGIEQGLRERIAGRRELAAELAGVRATAGLLAVLPLLGLALGSALGGDPLDLMLHNTVGELCLAAGAGLSMVGIWWTGRLIGSVGQAPPVRRRSGFRPRRGPGPATDRVADPAAEPAVEPAGERWVEPESEPVAELGQGPGHVLTGGGT